jgi:hypothetical protein
MSDDDALTREVDAARTLARQLGLTPEPTEPDPERLRRDDEILAWVLAQPRDTRARRPTVRHRRIAVLTAAAVVALFAVISVPLGWWSSPAAATGTPQMLAYTAVPTTVIDGTAPGGSEVLRDLAARAHDPAGATGGGTIQRISSTNWFAHMRTDDEGRLEAVIYPTDMDSWLSQDGSLVNRERRGAALDANGRITDDPDWGAPVDSEDVLPPGTVDRAVIEDLPREVGALRAALLDRMAPMDCSVDPARRAWCLAAEISNLNHAFIIPGDLEAALWRVLADEPSIGYLGTVTDRAGRQAVAIAAPPLPDLGYTRVLVLLADPDTGVLLGEEQIDTDSPELGIEQPSVTGFTCYTSRAWVAEIPPSSGASRASSPARTTGHSSASTEK